MTQEIALTGAQSQALLPKSYEGMVDLAARLANSEMVPKHYLRKPDACLAGMMFAVGLGMHPVLGLNSIAVVNGRPTVWGDAVAGLPMQKGLVKNFREWAEGVKGAEDYTWHCEVEKANGEMVLRTFSVADAKRAGLTNKSNTPWQTYPDRMLQMRARGFAFRDAAPQAFVGCFVEAPAGEEEHYQGPEHARVINAEEEPGDRSEPTMDDVIDGILADGDGNPLRYDDDGVILESETPRTRKLPRDYMMFSEFVEGLVTAVTHGELADIKRVFDAKREGKPATVLAKFDDEYAKAGARIDAAVKAEIDDDPAEGWTDPEEAA